MENAFRELPDEPDGTTGPIQQPRLRYATAEDAQRMDGVDEGDLIIPAEWDLEQYAWELFRLQNRADARREREEELRAALNEIWVTSHEDAIKERCRRALEEGS